MNANELKINDEIVRACDPKAIYKVVGFDSTYGTNYDQHGVLIVRFIKSRNEWAKVGQALFCKEDGELSNWTAA